MARHEKLAMERDYKEEVIEGVKGKVRNLILPILVLITVTVFMMIHTGSEALAADGKPFSLLGAFENTTVGISLVVGGSSAVAMSTLLIILERQVSLQEYGKAWIAGIKSMLGAIAILFFAWTINKVVGDAQTGKYLSSLVSGSIPVQFLPVILFILGSAMAFSTGTSWGTFWHYVTNRSCNGDQLCSRVITSLPICRHGWRGMWRPLFTGFGYNDSVINWSKM